MAEDDTSNAQALQQPEPNPDLRNLDRLVGTWEISGGAQGRATYEWMEGDFFLIQRVDLQQHGQKIKGIEIIGHERQFGAEPSEDIGSRFYDNMGNTLDYVYELEGDTLTIWGGERGSPAYYRGTFSEDDKTISGAWHYPGAAVTRRLRPESNRGGSDGRRYSQRRFGGSGFINSATPVVCRSRHVCSPACRAALHQTGARSFVAFHQRVRDRRVRLDNGARLSFTGTRLCRFVPGAPLTTKDHSRPYRPDLTPG